jgi:hypothetical protein
VLSSGGCVVLDDSAVNGLQYNIADFDFLPRVKSDNFSAPGHVLNILLFQMVRSTEKEYLRGCSC